MKTKFLLALLTVTLVVNFSSAQESKPISSGSFGLGMRTTESIFLGDNAAGFGTGGQFKILFAHRVNSEWFLDYLNSSAGLNGYRKDTHIGWSVQFAVNKGGYQTLKPVPFIEAGQCFDWTKIGFVTKVNQDANSFVTPVTVGPNFSVATQAGAGIAWFPLSKLEIEVESQYMIHIAKEVHLEFDSNNHAYKINQSKGTSFAGHILGTLSVTWYLFQPNKKP